MSRRDFVHILSFDYNYSSPVCLPNQHPTVPTTVSPYAGDTTPSHAHRIISPDVRYYHYLFHFSLTLLTDTTVIHACKQEYPHTLITPGCITNQPKHNRYSCLQNRSTHAQSLLLVAQPIYPRTFVMPIYPPIYSRTIVLFFYTTDLPDVSIPHP